MIKKLKFYFVLISNYVILYISKLTPFRLYRNSGTNYRLADNGMGSHEKYLKIILNNLEEGDIVFEIGLGYNSSSYIIKKVNNFQKSYSYHFENNLNWYNKISAIKKTEKNKLIFVKNNYLEDLMYQLNKIDDNLLKLTFIDSSPWSSRTQALELLKDVSKILIIHDSAYFPINNYWGTNLDDIKFNPKSRFWYGKLTKDDIGNRNYDDVFKYWIEFYPIYPGYYTGPPTLIGSNFFDVTLLFKNLDNELYLSHKK